MRLSMGRRGEGWGIAVTESVSSTSKTELIYRPASTLSVETRKDHNIYESGGFRGAAEDA